MLTSTIILLFVAAIVAAALHTSESRRGLLTPSSRKRSADGRALPDLHNASAAGYIQHGSLLTPAERSFFGVLEQAVGDRFRIMAKVRIADVLKPQEGLDRPTWRSAFNRISAKHFDFLLCRAGDLGFVCAIELNDRSHGKFLRRRRDTLIDSICESARLPLVTFAARRGYSARELRETISQVAGVAMEWPQLSVVADSA
jgi:hypothetical protein